ncbi:MAG: hypothetical protein HY796_03400 [Elusimicrobia bacterium]|nr:hypothetical protein [Elusimicrobiota bacterium]
MKKLRPVSVLVFVPAIVFFLSAQPLKAAQAAFSDGSHSVMVRVSNGQSAYIQKIPITEGSQGNFLGPVKAPNSVPKQMIFNGLLSRGGGAESALNLQYQLELSSGRGSGGRSFQGQSEVVIRPGDELTVITCGPWTVTLGLDVKPGLKKPSRAGAWNPAGLPNYRLTADMRAGGSKQQCRLISKAGVQSNVADSIAQGGRKYGFILNALFAPSGNDGEFSLQYQLELGLNPFAKSVQTQNETALTLNRRKTFSEQNYRLEFLLEDGTRPAKQTGGGKKGRLKITTTRLNPYKPNDNTGSGKKQGADMRRPTAFPARVVRDGKK